MKRDLYIYEKRAVHICEKRPMQEEGYSLSCARKDVERVMTCDTYVQKDLIYIKKDKGNEKRHTYMWKETYAYVREKRRIEDAGSLSCIRKDIVR